MKEFVLVVCIVIGSVPMTNAQNIDFSFTAENNGTFVQLDSVWVINSTQECDTVLYYPDSVLTLQFSAVEDHRIQESSFRLYDCYPNPVVESTKVKIYVPEEGTVSLIVTNTIGGVVLNEQRQLDKGLHYFDYFPCVSGLHFLTANWKDRSQSIRVVNTAKACSGIGRLEYQGTKMINLDLKERLSNNPFVYYVEDRMWVVGYAGGLESGLIDKPRQGKDYKFQFATNIPCPGTPEVEYEGQIYHTIQIFNQCWFKENLNAGYMRERYFPQTNNDTIEKYCYHDEAENCLKYGGLYFWDEMMNYSKKEGTQGICPPGWHIPSDDEFKLLAGAVDSIYGIGDSIWNDVWFHHGSNVAYRLKSKTGWWQNGNGNDLFGFAALPGGLRWHNTNFNDEFIDAYFWTSTEHTYSTSWYRLIYYNDDGIYRNGDFRKITGLSIRCVKDL